jgi:hypothetical protein
MYKNATKCNETICKWCKNKHGASKIIDTFETYHPHPLVPVGYEPGLMVVHVGMVERADSGTFSPGS